MYPGDLHQPASDACRVNIHSTYIGSLTASKYSQFFGIRLLIGSNTLLLQNKGVNSMDFASFKSQFVEQLYDEYHVKLYLKDCAGGTPMNKDLIGGWINATNKDKSEEERRALIDATLENLPELSEEKESKSWVGFKSDKKTGHLFIEGRCVKAMLKEAANIIKDLAPNGGNQVGKNKGKPKGVTAFKSKVADRVFVIEDRVYFKRDGEFITSDTFDEDSGTEDEREERPVHAMTPQGPRSSLKRTDILKDVEVEFHIRRLATNDVPEPALFACLVYAQQIGLGADRSQSRGVMKDVECEKIKSASKNVEAAD